MNRRKIKNAAGCIITIGLTLFLLCGLSKVLERKAADMKYTDFFEEEEDFDVLFFGDKSFEVWNFTDGTMA